MHFAIAWRRAYTCEVKPPPLQRRRMSTPANLSWPRVSSGSYTCQGRRSLQTQFDFDRIGIPMAARWRHSLLDAPIARALPRLGPSHEASAARSVAHSSRGTQAPTSSRPPVLSPLSCAAAAPVVRGRNYYCGCGYKGELRTISSVLRQHENAMMQAKHTTNTLQKTAGFLAGSVGPSVPGRRGRARNERLYIRFVGTLKHCATVQLPQLRAASPGARGIPLTCLWYLSAGAHSDWCGQTHRR